MSGSWGVLCFYLLRKAENNALQFKVLTTRWYPYMVGVVDGERRYFFHVEPVDIFLEQTKQGKVQRG